MSKSNTISSQLLPRDFYDRPVELVARELLGMTLVRQDDEGVTAGRIVETEAYLAQNDPAAHSARGKTRSNASMFASPGTAYVYPIHSRYCVNVVTEAENVGSAVLIRAIEPTEGSDLMRRRRGKERLTDLTRGPARLCEAMAINRDLDGLDLTTGPPIWITESGFSPTANEIGESVRIGVTSAQELPLRFFIIGNKFVSGSRALNSG
jgi:DNA-3-methyladenine glycosylase